MGDKEVLGLVKVNIFWSLGDSVASVTQWWRENVFDGPLNSFVSVGGAADFAEVVAHHLDDTLRTRRTVDSLLTGARATVYTNSFPAVTGEWAAAIAGTSASAASLPPQCAAVMSLRTIYTGRSYRGRNYLPYLAVWEDPLDYTTPYVTLDGGFRDALEELYPVGLALNDNASGSHTMELQVYSPTLGIAHPVVDVSVDARIDTMRSRNG